MSKFVAYVFKSECVKTEYDPFGNEVSELIKFDKPQEKMIASGTEEFCNDALDRYIKKHPGATGGVMETMAQGDPWHSFWSRV